MDTMPLVKNFTDGSKYWENTENSELCMIFSGDDTNGYSYIACSPLLNMKTVAQNINNALNGRGGGRDTMIQGKVAATKDDIVNFINKFIG